MYNSKLDLLSILVYTENYKYLGMLLKFIINIFNRLLCLGKVLMKTKNKN